MITQITDLHHVTSLASNARENNAFFTQVLGLRRVKKTANFDVPDPRLFLFRLFPDPRCDLV